MQTRINSLRTRWEQAKLTKAATFWIAIGAIAIAVFLGFSRGGWVVGSTAEKNATDGARDAVVERLTTICVAQYDADGAHAEKLVEMQALTSTAQRSRFVSEQGWATMPGDETSDSQIADACARQLMLVDG